MVSEHLGNNLISLSVFSGFHRYENNMYILFDINKDNFNQDYFFHKKIELSQEIFKKNEIEDIFQEVFHSILNYHNNVVKQISNYELQKSNKDILEDDIIKIISNITFHVVDDIEDYQIKNPYLIEDNSFDR